MFELVLSNCGVIVLLSVIIKMSPSIPFPFLVAAEQKGGQGSGYYISLAFLLRPAGATRCTDGGEK